MTTLESVFLRLRDARHNRQSRHLGAIMKVGFTGTQHGMTDAQKDQVHTILFAVAPVELHHGDCVGADAQANQIAYRMGATRVVHPPTVVDKRALCVGNETRDPKPYLDRNHDIVDETEFLVATPKSAQEELRSGTWATIRYAEKTGKDVYIVFPDGSVDLRHAGDRRIVTREEFPWT